MIASLAHAGHEHTDSIAASLPLLAGVLAGGAHVFMGPDHMAAVAPLAAEQRRRTWLAGCVWGLGHSGGMWLLALGAILFRETLPIDAISSWSEWLVGVVLIGIGVWGILRVVRLRVHTHTHEHTSPDGETHTHAHTHAHTTKPGEDHEHTHAHSHSHGLLGIGALHGFAGTHHLIGVLPALAMPSRAAAVTYVIAFGIGTIAAMGLFAGALGMLIRASDRAGRGLSKGVMAGCSIAAIAIGVYWLVPSGA